MQSHICPWSWTQWMNRFSHVVLRPIPFERNNWLSLLFTFRQYRQSTKTLLILWIFRDGRLHDVLVACFDCFTGWLLDLSSHVTTCNIFDKMIISLVGSSWPYRFFAHQLVNYTPAIVLHQFNPHSSIQENPHG